MRRKARLAEIMPALLKLQKRGNYMHNDSDNAKDTVKKIWDKPIVQVGAAVAGYQAIKALGKRLGSTTYTTDRKLRKF